MDFNALGDLVGAFFGGAFTLLATALYGIFAFFIPGL